MYQNRKDVLSIHFNTLPQPSNQHHHGSCGMQQQLGCFLAAVDSPMSTELKEPTYFQAIH